MADGLLNKASIILTPTGYKAGTLYNVAPVVEPYEDFDFARASVASRVNSSGLVEMVGRTLSSELVTCGDFSCADPEDDWTLETGWSIGDEKAIVTNTGTRSIYQNIGTPNTSKIYKVNYEILSTNGGNFKFSYGGVSGTIRNTTGIFTEYIQPTSSSDSNIYFDALNVFTGSITNVSVKEIIDTNNIPRISYDSNGDNGHILLEPTSTNLFEYSESFNTAEWNRSSITVVDNSSQSPDGTNSASLMYPSSSGNFRYLHNSTIASSSKYTISAFVKASGKNVVWMYINSSSQNGLIYYDLSDQTTQVVSGSVGTPTATIESYNNDWYKISYTLGTGVILNGGSGLGVSDAKGDAAVTVNGTDGVLVWGLQLEALSYATSYIPTLTGSQETRATETATGAGSATLINSTEGVLYAEIAGLVDADTYDRIISLSDNTTTNRVEMQLSSSGSIKGRFDSASSDITLTEAGLTASNFNKIALVWSSGKCALFINGIKEQEDLTFSTFASNVLFDLSFKSPYNDADGSRDFYGKCKALAVFNEALSDDELNNLTG